MGSRSRITSLRARGQFTRGLSRHVLVLVAALMLFFGILLAPSSANATRVTYGGTTYTFEAGIDSPACFMSYTLRQKGFVNGRWECYNSFYLTEDVTSRDGDLDTFFIILANKQDGCVLIDLNGHKLDGKWKPYSPLDDKNVRILIFDSKGTGSVGDLLVEANVDLYNVTVRGALCIQNGASVTFHGGRLDCSSVPLSFRGYWDGNDIWIDNPEPGVITNYGSLSFVDNARVSITGSGTYNAVFTDTDLTLPSSTSIRMTGGGVALVCTGGTLALQGNATIYSTSCCVGCRGYSNVIIGGNTSLETIVDDDSETVPAVANLSYGTVTLCDSCTVHSSIVGIRCDYGVTRLLGSASVYGDKTAIDGSYYSSEIYVGGNSRVGSSEGYGIFVRSGTTAVIADNAKVEGCKKTSVVSYGNLTIAGDATISGKLDEGQSANSYDSRSCVRSSGTTTIKDSATIRDGSSWRGGGLCVDGGTCTICGNATVCDNKAYFGGGVYVKEGSLTVKDQSSISGNKSRSRGGGICAESNYPTVPTVQLSGSCVVSRNTVDGMGGGIWSNGILSLSESASVSDNSASGGAGGILAKTIPGSEGSCDVLSLSGNVAIFSNRCGALNSNVVLTSAGRLFWDYAEDGARQLAGSETTVEAGVRIDGTLTSSGKIGISNVVESESESAESESCTAAGIITSSGWGTYHSSEDPSVHFRCEASGFCLALTPAHEIQMISEEMGRPTTYSRNGETWTFSRPIASAAQLLEVTGSARATTSYDGYYLVDNITLPSTWELRGSGPWCEFDLDLNGCSITISSPVSVITVDDCHLKLFDSRGTGSVSGGFGSAVFQGARGAGGGIGVGGYSTARDARSEALSLYGVQVSGNNAPGYGGGVSVRSSSVVGPSSLELFDDSNVYGNSSSVGGGIAAEDGASVTLNDSSSVQANRSSITGGGIHAGIVAMNGASRVCDNTSGLEGGGLWSASLVTCDSVSIDHNSTSTSAGGAYVREATMLGYSSIRDNEADCYGGGLVVERSLSLGDSASVLSNRAGQGAGGVLAVVSDSPTSLWPASVVRVSQSAGISQNTCGGFSSNLALESEEGNGTRRARLELMRSEDCGNKIGVRCVRRHKSFDARGELLPAPASITSNYSLAGSADRYLFSEIEGYGLEFNETGQVTFVPHHHEWAYVAQGNRVLAWCTTTSTTCDHFGQEHAFMLAITAEDMEWSGKPYDRVRVENGITNATGAAASVVEFYRAASAKDTQVAGKQRLASAPSDAGEYIAAVRVGGAVAAAHFAILPEPVEAMHRLYNPNSGEHFYTASVGERDACVRAGWRYEDIGWTAPKSGPDVYRLYNKNAGDHHYTLSASERDSLKRAGWIYEGVAWHSDARKRVPLYRQYNPNAISGSHNYTKSTRERDSLVRAGWRDEGIGWYGVR